MGKAITEWGKKSQKQGIFGPKFKDFYFWTKLFFKTIFLFHAFIINVQKKFLYLSR